MTPFDTPALPGGAALKAGFLDAGDRQGRLAVLHALRDAGLDRVVFHDAAPEAVTDERWLALLDGADL